MPKNSGRGSRPRKRSYAKGGYVTGGTVMAGRLFIPPGITFSPSGGWSIDPIIGREDWRVQPTEELRGSIGRDASWVARWQRNVAPKQEVQFATYECEVTVVEQRDSWSREAFVLGPYSVLHRPDEGDVMLAAKVLAMVSVQPGWREYKERVTKGW